MSKLSLVELKDIDGFSAAALVDVESGLSLASEGALVNLDLAAAGNANVLKAKRKIAESLGHKVNDILIDLYKEYHLIRPLERNPDIFIYLILDHERSNLALARHILRQFEQNLDFA